VIDPEILSFGGSVPVTADSNLIEDVADSPRIGFVRLEKCRRRVWLPEIAQNACNPQTARTNLSTYIATMMRTSSGEGSVDRCVFEMFLMI